MQQTTAREYAAYLRKCWYDHQDRSTRFRLIAEIPKFCAHNNIRPDVLQWQLLRHGVWWVGLYAVPIGDSTVLEVAVGLRCYVWAKMARSAALLGGFQATKPEKLFSTILPLLAECFWIRVIDEEKKALYLLRYHRFHSTESDTSESALPSIASSASSARVTEEIG